ncbi:hypothetical protein EDD16DRAFT_1694427 [Pisolithus croceorrhizus]|nr:hypothetical protein EDD16DRAFT_1694427 [Pisolithus croceorrhizus]KAI6119692.1 hypothetical protein EV401DRAFT_2057098 [Pisolithus croceorrhizus]KAI6156312.1 hypothetical protein EDD17DRAFT_1779673 [Pisolithus thermaeus]
MSGCHSLLPHSPHNCSDFWGTRVFHIAWLHSPHFSIQGFIKTLCDLQGVTFQCYLSHQFTITFDLYLQICAHVDLIMSQVLQWDSEDWHLKHARAACTYKLTGESELRFKLLYAMDRNDLLKCILWHLPDEIEDGHLPLSHDLPTSQVLTSSHYLSCKYVNKFDVTGNTDPFSDEDSDTNPCTGQWKNMDDVKTRKAWGVYDKTGIFIAVCHHGTCQLIVDMVQSGEHAKYPLAVASKLMTAFSDGLGGRSALRSQVHVLNHTCLVGAFHGHAHHCLCQLSHLTLYVEGLGLEDLETCEHTFSKSNALASTQVINAYFEHNNHFEVYALVIICDSKTILPNLKCDLSIDDDNTFYRWLEEEKEYLEGLSCEPLEETLHMEYWQRLGKLEPVGATTYSGDTRVTWQNETLCQHAQENYNRELLLVQDLECKLNISWHWVPEDKEWQDAGHLVANWEYHHVLDNLESLVVAWLFELTKMNRAGTGYKLQKHIAKALQTHSTTIKVTLDHYNKCTLAVQPPCQMLRWEQVIEYTFLADFDLLWDMCEDISQHLWADPTAHFAIDTYFKMHRAEEEIKCLNIKICQVITYMCDEEHFLHMCKEKISNIHPALTHQVSQCHKCHSQFNGSHLKCLHDIAILPGFSGTLHPGESALKGPVPIQQPLSSQPLHGDTHQDLEEEEDIEHEVEEASHTLQDVLEVSLDPE